MRKVALAALVSVGVIAFASPAAHAAFPGANGKIAFAGAGENVFSMNADGSDVTQLTTALFPDHSPRWSPDGKKILFTHCTDSGCNGASLNVMNADGTNNAGVKAGLDPTWSPDGSKIAFASIPFCSTGEPCEENEVYTMNADGTGVTRLEATTLNGVSESDLAWSPDGATIALRCVFEVVEVRICTMNPDGTGLTQLTTSGGDHPDWSPDGRKIVFRTTSPTRLDVMNRDGTGRTTIVSGSDTPSDPAWSPDGSKIVFYAQAGGDIFTVNPDGSGRTNVGNVLGSGPNWQPLGALDPYPRPGGATPLRVPLVPVFTPCTAPNSSHAAPLAEPSCEPPTPESSLLTTSATGRGQGSLRMDVQVGNPLTPADEADVAISVAATDVRNASGAIDYTGQVIFTTALQITDRANGFGGVSGTTGLFGFSAPVGCTPSPDPQTGSSCTLNTTADSLVAGTAKEGKRAVVSTRLIRLLDLGPDGQLSPNCPPTCGTGDEKPFLGAGVFAP